LGDGVPVSKLTKNESVFLTETPDGYAITPYDPALNEEKQARRSSDGCSPPAQSQGQR
jgi:hypothetical protein